MIKSDIQCLKCGAGYRRLELVSRKGRPGPLNCRACNGLLEVSDGAHEIAYRLTVLPGNFADLLDGKASS